jgi:hypothetical protein
MTEKYYLIKSFKTNKIYYVNYLKDKENEIIFFGGVRQKCVIVTIDTDNLTGERKGILQTIQYFDKCVIYNKLNRGDQLVDLVHCSLLFLIKKFPEIDTVELSDSSEIKCKNNESITLADYYYVKHGQTWYEKHFNVKADKNNIEEIQLAKRKITKELKKKINLTPDDFIKKYYNGFDDQESIRAVYYQNITLKEFLHRIINQAKDCSYYVKIFKDKIKNRLKHKNWIIKKQDIEKYIVKFNISYKSKKIKKEIGNINLAKLKVKLDKIIEKENSRMSFKFEDLFP